MRGEDLGLTELLRGRALEPMINEYFACSAKVSEEILHIYRAVSYSLVPLSILIIKLLSRIHVVSIAGLADPGSFPLAMALIPPQDKFISGYLIYNT